jgi:predicted  nucleic acid-binding Zn-ribbon protein
MEVNAEKFMNLVVEKTTQKMQAFQGQVIVLEAQLQLALEQIKQLQDELNNRIKDEEPKNGKSSNKTGTY